MFKRTEYVTNRLGLTFRNWSDTSTALEQLLLNGYHVFMTSKEKYNDKLFFYKEYELHFVHPDFEGETFTISDNYREYEVGGEHYTEVREHLEISGFEGAAEMVQSLLDNDYELYISTDNETFGGKYPLNFSIHYVHKNEESLIEMIEI